VDAAIFGNDVAISGSMTLQGVTVTAISGSGLLQNVGPALLGNDLSVSGSTTLNEVTFTELSGSGGLQVVNEVILGNNLTVSGSSILKEITATSLSASGVVNIANSISSSGDVAATGSMHAAYYYGDGSNLTNVGGGGGVTVGNAVGSGAGSRVLYEDASNNLAESANLKFDGTTLFPNAVKSGAISGSSTLEIVGNTILGGDTFVSGNVGIGRSASLKAQLHLSSSVRGVANQVGYFRVESPGRAIANPGDPGDDLASAPLLFLTASSGDSYEGRLGINKDQPAGALHVTSKGSDTLVVNEEKVCIGSDTAASLLQVKTEDGKNSEVLRVTDTDSGDDSQYELIYASGSHDGNGYFGSNASGVTFTVSGSSQLAGVTATTISASSTLQAVGNATFGGNVAVSGTVTFAGGGTINNTTIGATTPSTVAMTAGFVAFSGSITDTTYAVTSADYILGVDTTSNAVEVDLEAAGTAGAGRMLIIKDISGSAGTNNITVDPNGSELIDGQSSLVIAANSGSVMLFCDSHNWYIAGTR